VRELLPYAHRGWDLVRGARPNHELRCQEAIIATLDGLREPRNGHSPGEVGQDRLRPLDVGLDSRDIGHVPLGDLRPAPENAALYAPVDPKSPETLALAQSMAARGVLEPLVISIHDLEGYEPNFGCPKKFML
jgi:hypothetical protein